MSAADGLVPSARRTDAEPAPTRWESIPVSASTWTAFCRQMIVGVSASDTAKELGISVDSAYAAKSRVLRMLRQEARGLID